MNSKQECETPFWLTAEKTVSMAAGNSSYNGEQ